MILALDVGSYTQDLFLWQEGAVIENCVQMVLPSPTSIFARRIKEATIKGRPVHLHGHLMGGGPMCWALKDHLKAGYRVTATPEAALTIRDDLERVRRMGVEIIDYTPDDAELIQTGDIQREQIEGILSRLGFDPPEVWCVAVQDHGFQPKGSNRVFRFSQWKAFMDRGGHLSQAIYGEPPASMTRMQAVLQQVPRGYVMDTGMAAIHGALCDPNVNQRAREEGLVVINIGNQHTLAALVAGERVWGIWEHHTGALDSESLQKWMDRFIEGSVSHEEVLESGGHGCCYHPDGIPQAGFGTVVVTGPRRQIITNGKWILAAPFGNMMLAGCFGLIRAYFMAHDIPWP
jgi:uncharacterized protein (DUF1786 family)